VHVRCRDHIVITVNLVLIVTIVPLDTAVNFVTILTFGNPLVTRMTSLQLHTYVCLLSCKCMTMTGGILMKFCVNVMPLRTIKIHSFQFRTLWNITARDAQIREVGTGWRYYASSSAHARWRHNIAIITLIALLPMLWLLSCCRIWQDNKKSNGCTRSPHPR
jgi:hypothetical protein